MIIEIEYELKSIESLLREGTYPGGNVIIELKPQDEEKYRNTAELYKRILCAVAAKSDANPLELPERLILRLKEDYGSVAGDSSKMQN